MKKVLFALMAYIIWCVLTWGGGLIDLIFGLVPSILLAAFFSDMLFIELGVLLNFRRLYHFIWYMFVFLYELAAASVVISFQALRPRLRINDRVIKVKSALKTDTEKALFISSIAFSLNTLCLDVSGGYAYVHVMNTTKEKMIKEHVLSRHEKIVKGVFA
jgi:multisubunit Na+/H+ antiporter MnhE subunit